jgi:hypothetical protein
MQHDELTPLLLMREELQPKPSRMSTLYAQQARTTIVHSPLYNEAIQRFYYSGALTYHPSTPRNARPQDLLTPPPTIHRAGSSRKLEHLASLNDASASDGPGSSTKLPPFILHDPNIYPSRFYQLDPDSDSSDDTIAEDPQIEAEVTVIDSDSDQELSQVTVPFLVVFWTIVRLYS